MNEIVANAAIAMCSITCSEFRKIAGAGIELFPYLPLLRVLILMPLSFPLPP